jgi:hypothetical protein
MLYIPTEYLDARLPSDLKNTGLVCYYHSEMSRCYLGKIFETFQNAKCKVLIMSVQANIPSQLLDAFSLPNPPQPLASIEGIKNLTRQQRTGTAMFCLNQDQHACIRRPSGKTKVHK